MELFDWKDLDCHLSSKWDLQTTTEIDLGKLKRQVEVDLKIAPDFMRVESLLYLAFLEVSPTGKMFFRTRIHNRQNALKLIKEAEEYVTATMKSNNEAHNGYGIVINALRMWIFSFQNNIPKQEEVLKKLDKLYASCVNNKKAGAFIKVTQAAALTRLGFQRYEEAQELFEQALIEYPRNTHWMFGRALMQGRLARNAKSRINLSADLPLAVQKQFEIEMGMLKEIREIDPSFAWPIAYLGWCHFNLKEKGKALACLEDAMNRDKENSDIALISARIHKWIKKLDKCQDILESLPEASKTAEVEFQIALVYNQRAQNVFYSNDSQWSAVEDKNKEYAQLVQNALAGVEKTLAKDTCHLPAATKRAELTARLGLKENATDFYCNLFEREDVQQVPLNQVHVRASFNQVKNSFEPSEVLDNIYKMLQLCIRKFIHFDENGKGTFDDRVQRDAERFLKDLEDTIKKENEDSLLARLVYSEVQRGFKNYRGAKELIQTLLQKKCPQPNQEIQSNWEERHRVQLKWNLAKCHVGLGNFSKADKIARDLERLPPQRQFPANEIHSDICLAKAEKKLNGETVFARLENYNFVLENLHNAIALGSMKACYWYLTKVDDLQERLCCFNSSTTILQTIVEIEACLERNETCHNSFEECPDNIADFIKAKIKAILVHPAQEIPGISQSVQKRFTQLSSIRSYLHKFEGCYRQASNLNEGWNEFCQEKAERVLSHARNILDHVISDFQEKVFQNQNFRGKKPKSYFPIFVDWRKEAPDEEMAEQEVINYVTEYFPGFNMPKEMITCFTKIQPRYNRDNLWLAVLNDFNINSKHKGEHDKNERYQASKNRYITYRKVDLVRKSCSEVEKVVKDILTFLNDKFP